jgi:hypothetical protein
MTHSARCNRCGKGRPAAKRKADLGLQSTNHQTRSEISIFGSSLLLRDCLIVKRNGLP